MKGGSVGEGGEGERGTVAKTITGMSANASTVEGVRVRVSVRMSAC